MMHSSPHSLSAVHKGYSLIKSAGPSLYLKALAVLLLAVTFLAVAATAMQAACLHSLTQGLLFNLLLEGLHLQQHCC